jgi:hypothetical protein
MNLFVLKYVLEPVVTNREVVDKSLHNPVESMRKLARL